MKNTILYFANLALLPLVCVVFFAVNMFKLTRQAIRWTVSDITSSYHANRRYYNRK